MPERSSKPELLFRVNLSPSWLRSVWLLMRTCTSTKRVAQRVVEF
jgi:hypothetical protein